MEDDLKLDFIGSKADGLKLFIDYLNQIDKVISFIGKHGACYQFAKFFRTLIPECEMYISSNQLHVVVKLEDRFFDIGGEISSEGYSPLSLDKEEEIATSWSFSNLYYYDTLPEDYY